MSSESRAESLLMLMAVLVDLAVAVIIWGILSYIFTGLGLMGMANKKNEKNSWLSWIPFANGFLLGKLAFGKNAGGIAVLLVTIGVPILYIILGANYVKIIKYVLFIATLTFNYITYYKIYKQFSKSHVVMLVFTILTGGFLAPVFMFAIRNNELIEKNSNISSQAYGYSQANDDNYTTTTQQTTTNYVQQDNNTIDNSTDENIR